MLCSKQTRQDGILTQVVFADYGGDSSPAAVKDLRNITDDSKKPKEGRLADCTGGLRETPNREYRFAELLKIAAVVTKRKSKPLTRGGLVLYTIDGRNGYFVRCETGLTVGIRYVKSTFRIEGFRCVSG